jgi:N-acetylglutamate synthase
MRYADPTRFLMVELREFTFADYDEVVALWRITEGLVLRDVDQAEAIARYLTRNPGLSFVAIDQARIVGAVLCGTDGRRGYLQHLAVAPTHRRRGVGRALAQRCVEALSQRDLDKCHLMVLPQNEAARAFWRRLGWQDRDDVRLMSHVQSGSPTA